jgi:hypothetical protein
LELTSSVLLHVPNWYLATRPPIIVMGEVRRYFVQYETRGIELIVNSFQVNCKILNKNQ